MKILYTCTYSAGISGVWNRVYNVAREMIKKGHEVFVFSSNLEAGSLKKVPEHEVVDRINCYRFPVRVTLSKNALGFGKSSDKMREKLKEINPDVVDCQTYRHSEGTIVSSEAEKLGIPCFLTTHAPFVSVGVRGIVLSTITRLYDAAYSGNVLKKFRKIIAISKWEYPYLTKLGVESNKIAYVPNGIPVEFFKKERKLGREVRKVLFFGRIAPVKDIETLLRAWALIEKANNKVVLEIIGPAELEYRKRLDEMIMELKLENVRFGEAVFALNEKIRAYNNAEVFVLPSKREGMPQSLIEAMSAGDIVIASDITACREIVKNGKNGYLFRQGNAEDLAKKLDFAIKSYRKLGGVVEKAKKDSSSFGWDRIADRLEKLYKSK